MRFLDAAVMIIPYRAASSRNRQHAVTSSPPPAPGRATPRGPRTCRTSGRTDGLDHVAAVRRRLVLRISAAATIGRAAHKPGDRVQARVARDGTLSTVQLTLSNLTS